MEQPVVHGVRIGPAETKVTVAGIPSHVVAGIFRRVAELGVPVGLASQSLVATGRTDVTFTVAETDGPLVVAALRGYGGLSAARVAAVTLTGAGLRAAPAMAATFCEALARAGIPLEIVSVEGNRISAVCMHTRRDMAARALCEAFEVGVLPEYPDFSAVVDSGVEAADVGVTGLPCG